MIKSAFVGTRKDLFDWVYTEEQKARIAQLTELVTPELVSPEALDSTDLSQAEVFFSTWGIGKITEEQLDKMPKLKAVFYAAGATDHFAAPLLSRGIQVSSAWRANALPVAEFAMAQIILSMKNYFADNRAFTAPDRHHVIPYGPGNYGEKVVLIGNGAVSTHLKRLLESCLTLTVEQIPTKEVTRERIAEAFRTGYVISNHLPNLPDTEGLFNEELFLSMRQYATFINTGRGAQVDEAGLIRALQARPDLTALLDVTWPEPPVAGSPLYTMPNVHLSSHLAGSLNDETHRMAELAIGEFQRYEKGLPLEHLVAWEDICATKKRSQ